MKIINAQGNIILKNRNGIEEVVISISHGATYGIKDQKNLTTTNVTVYPPHNGLQDQFIFYEKGKIPFNHIQSRELNPFLKDLYVHFILAEDYCISNFISLLITDYFIGYAGYSFPDNTDISEINI